VSSTSTSMTLKWDAPLNDGGCPITSYALFRDDGLTLNPTIEVNIDDDPDIRNIPTLRIASATLDNADLGKKFTFQLRAYNREGYVAARNVLLLFATIPPTPSNSPTIIQTTTTSITVQYQTLLNGGSPIISYQLQYALAYDGTWITVNGQDNDSLRTLFTVSNLVKG